MADTYLDQIVTYPSEVIRRIGNDKTIVGLLVNKKPTDVSEDDVDEVFDRRLYDYEYVDETTNESTAYVWVEMEVNSVSNKHIKDIRLYVTVACHKSYMKLDNKFVGFAGNRRDNIVRYVDKLLNSENFLGIGALSLQSVKTLTSTNGFTMRLLTYEIPDFNVVELDDD